MAAQRPGRLAEAALELYAERGYDQVTVAEIAEQAGLTDAAYFRYFADKREVLFGQAGQVDRAVDRPDRCSTGRAPHRSLPPSGWHWPRSVRFSTSAAIRPASGSRHRHNPSLQECELIARTVDPPDGDALCRRGVDRPTTPGRRDRHGGVQVAFRRVSARRPAGD